MKVPVSWLKEFVDVTVEPERLGLDLSEIGLALDGFQKDRDDAVLDLDITTNRVDCMNVYGVAREVSVMYGVPLKPLPVDFSEAGAPSADALAVSIEAPDLCTRFCARVFDVRMGISPEWLRDRLDKVGVRPISNLVDLTNYVMMEMGQPTHAFDLAKLPDARLVARWGRPGEKITTLDGALREIPERPRVGVVASGTAPLALAGVMGGASSEVGDATRVIALEAAHWDPLSTRQGAKALGMHTEASHRFERGADREGAPLSTARIAHLLQKIGAGSARPGLIDVVGAERPPRRASLRSKRVALVLGAPVPDDRCDAILRGLGFTLGERHDGAVEAVIPTWRGDVTREVDLIEEVGRHHGLSKIPFTLPPASEAVGLKRWQMRERIVRQTMLASGFTEIASLSFLSEPAGLDFPGEPVRVANPIAEDQGLLRRSIVFPGLIQALLANLRQGRRDLRLFEIGRVFLPAERLAREERRLGVLLTGEMRGGHWSERGRRADFFDLKGLLRPLAERLRLPPFEIVREGLPAYLHPGKSGVVREGEREFGMLGALHPDVAERLGVREEVLVAELYLDPLLNAPASVARLRPITRYPAIARDLSVVCNSTVDAATLIAFARGAAGPLLRSALVVDRYQGPPLGEGRVSLTLALKYQDPVRTLKSEEVDQSVESVIAALREQGAEIRGE